MNIDVVRIMILAAKLAVVSTSVFAFVTVMVLVTSVIAVGMNITVLNDVIAIVQMWLPFNLVTVFLWLLTVAGAYMVYRLSLYAIAYLNAWSKN